MNFFRKSQHNKQEKAPGQVPDMQPVSSENQTSTESGSTTTVTESEQTESVAAPQDFTRSATFQAMVREEAKRLRMKEQMLTEPHLARLREAQRLNETKRENIEENLRRTQNQLELLRRYNELAMELQVLSFRPNEKEWPIHGISITSSGNLNISFEQEGVLTEPDGTTHNCKQYRQICVVRDGELYQQFLQVTKDKAEQARLATVKIKNNIVNLGDYPLTDKTAVDVDEIFSEKVKDFVGSLQKAAPGTAFPEMTVPVFRLS